MYRQKEWGKTAYDDLLQKYNISINHLFFILSEPDEKKVFRKIKRSTVGLKEIRKRHDLIVRKVNGRD